MNSPILLGASSSGGLSPFSLSSKRVVKGVPSTSSVNTIGELKANTHQLLSVLRSKRLDLEDYLSLERPLAETKADKAQLDVDVCVRQLAEARIAIDAQLEHLGPKLTSDLHCLLLKAEGSCRGLGVDLKHRQEVVNKEEAVHSAVTTTYASLVSTLQQRCTAAEASMQAAVAASRTYADLLAQVKGYVISVMREHVVWQSRADVGMNPCQLPSLVEGIKNPFTLRCEQVLDSIQETDDSLGGHMPTNHAPSLVLGDVLGSGAFSSSQVLHSSTATTRQQGAGHGNNSSPPMPINTLEVYPPYVAPMYEVRPHAAADTSQSAASLYTQRLSKRYVQGAIADKKAIYGREALGYVYGTLGDRHIDGQLAGPTDDITQRWVRPQEELALLKVLLSGSNVDHESFIATIERERSKNQSLRVSVGGAVRSSCRDLRTSLAGIKDALRRFTYVDIPALVAQTSTTLLDSFTTSISVAVAAAAAPEVTEVHQTASPRRASRVSRGHNRLSAPTTPTRTPLAQPITLPRTDVHTQTDDSSPLLLDDEGCGDVGDRVVSGKSPLPSSQGSSHDSVTVDTSSSSKRKGTLPPPSRQTVPSAPNGTMPSSSAQANPSRESDRHGRATPEAGAVVMVPTLPPGAGRRRTGGSSTLYSNCELDDDDDTNYSTAPTSPHHHSIMKRSLSSTYPMMDGGGGTSPVDSNGTPPLPMQPSPRHHHPSSFDDLFELYSEAREAFLKGGNLVAGVGPVEGVISDPFLDRLLKLLSATSAASNRGNGYEGEGVGGASAMGVGGSHPNGVTSTPLSQSYPNIQHLNTSGGRMVTTVPGRGTTTTTPRRRWGHHQGLNVNGSHSHQQHRHLTTNEGGPHLLHNLLLTRSIDGSVAQSLLAQSHCCCKACPDSEACRALEAEIHTSCHVHECLSCHPPRSTTSGISGVSLFEEEGNGEEPLPPPPIVTPIKPLYDTSSVDVTTTSGSSPHRQHHHPALDGHLYHGDIDRRLQEAMDISDRLVQRLGPNKSSPQSTPVRSAVHTPAPPTATDYRDHVSNLVASTPSRTPRQPFQVRRHSRPSSGLSVTSQFVINNPPTWHITNQQ